MVHLVPHSAFWCFGLVGDFTVKRPPKPPAEVLSTVPKSKEAVAGSMEKIRVLKKRLSGPSYVLLAMPSTGTNQRQSLHEVSLDTRATRLGTGRPRTLPCVAPTSGASASLMRGLLQLDGTELPRAASGCRAHT